MGKLRKGNGDTSKIRCPHCKSENAIKRIVKGKPTLYCTKCHGTFELTTI